MAETGAGEKKTIVVRVSPELRGKLDSVLKITGGSLNDAGIEALENWIATKLADPEIRAKALEELEAQEQALQVQRQVLQGLVGDGETPEKPAEPEPPAAKPPSPRRGGSKS